MAINSRTKGAAAEREFAQIVYDWTGVKMLRNLEQVRAGGHDLIVSDDEFGAVADAFRLLAIECKRYNSVTDGLIKAWWGQAKEQAENSRLVPVLAYRANRQGWRVIVPLWLINKDLSHDNSLDCTATISPVALCSIVREM